MAKKAIERIRDRERDKALAEFAEALTELVAAELRPLPASPRMARLEAARDRLLQLGRS
jgi:hypothetical protein